MNVAKDLVARMLQAEVLVDTSVIRIIKYFPSMSNQDQKKALLYNEDGKVFDSFNCNGINDLDLRFELKTQFPSLRINVIEDFWYITRLKDFNFFDGI